MLMGELLTAAGLDIPVKLMIFNNSTLGMVRAEMMVVGYQPWGTDVKNPDFGALATAAGIHGERVEKAADIRPAIERAFAHPGPALIDFVTDPRALAVPPHTTVEEVKGFALTVGKLVFSGEVAEAWQQARSNIRDVGPGALAVDLSQLDLSRLQFATTTIYHFLFVPITIGLSWLVAALHTWWHRSGNPDLRRLTRFFGTILVINIAIGVVTGLVQEFEFGMNWSEYSRFVGDVFGAPLAMEGLAAFFLESTFLGLWWFGWDVLPRRAPPADDLGGGARCHAVGGVHHGRQLLDAAPGGLRDQRRHRPAGADLDQRAVHEPGVRLGLHARDPGVAGDRQPGHDLGLGLADPARQDPRGVRALDEAVARACCSRSRSSPSWSAATSASSRPSTSR